MMELEVIRHKTSDLFFKGFFPEEVAASYSYQLQRMFESGAAREGDYFVVKKEGRPYLNVEIYRNNTRRIWETPPSLASGVSFSDKSELASALKPVFDFLDDPVYYFKPEDKLEIVISEDWKESEQIKEAVLSRGYSKFDELDECLINTPKNFTDPEAKLVFKSFTDLDPEDRFTLVHENNIIVNIFEHVTPAKLYQDYIEEGYDSEALWKFYDKEETPAGLIMPVFTSGLKNELRLINYHSAGSVEYFAEEAIYEIIRIAKKENVSKITFVVGSKDEKFKLALKNIGAVKINRFERYAKK